MSKWNWNDEQRLREIVSGCRCISEALRAMQLRLNGNNSLTLKKYIELYNIDISHFLDRRQLSKQRGDLRSKSNEELFVEHSTARGSLIKKRILTERLIEYKCAKCGNTGTWEHQKLSLQLEHKNGVNSDNRLENLEFLCPNCHSQTPTFAGRNTKGHSLRKRKKQEQQEKRNKEKEQKNIAITELITIIKKSNIDFSKYGWKKKVADLINKKPQKIKMWMVKYMPDEWATARH